MIDFDPELERAITEHFQVWSGWLCCSVFLLFHQPKKNRPPKIAARRVVFTENNVKLELFIVKINDLSLLARRRRENFERLLILRKFLIFRDFLKKKLSTLSDFSQPKKNIVMLCYKLPRISFYHKLLRRILCQTCGLTSSNKTSELSS